MLATNCITKIPQDIDIVLNTDGTVTVKAGTKAYIPNGVGVFDSITTTADLTVSAGTLTGDSFIFIDANGSANIALCSNCYSGSTAPSDPTSAYRWYDRTNNKLYGFNSDGTLGGLLSLPITKVYRDDSAITKIDQVFNGFGYIGSTVFGLPGVKVLMPNGRNEDGTLKNLEITTNSVVLNSTTQTYIDNAHYNCVLNNDADQIHTVESGYYYYTYERPELGANKRWYSEKDNMWYTCFAATPTVWTGDTQCIVLTYTYHESSPISDFEIKAPISVVNQSMSDYVVSSFVDATTGQWYRRYKSGWLEQGGIQAQGSGFTFTLIKPFLNTKYFVSAQMVSNSPNTNNVFVSFLNLRAQTTTYFQLEFTTYSDTVWYACGQGA